MFTPLTPELWVSQSRVFATNSGVFLNNGRACLIDPGVLPGEIQAMADFLAEKGAEAETIILTHSHWDHILGPEWFPGAKIVAQANYYAEVEGENGERIRQQIARWEAENGIERPAGQVFAIPLPDTVFEKQASLAVGSDLRLTLAYAPGHAADQLVVYHGDSGTLWASDILSDLEIPFVSHALSAYEDTLSLISQWELRALVPGHGQATDEPAEIRRRISEDVAYLTEIRELVEKAIGQGRSVEETVVLANHVKYRHPEDNRGPHRLNVESIYLELGGEADATMVGWGKSLTVMEDNQQNET